MINEQNHCVHESIKTFHRFNSEMHRIQLSGDIWWIFSFRKYFSRAAELILFWFSDFAPKIKILLYLFPFPRISCKKINDFSGEVEDHPVIPMVTESWYLTNIFDVHQKYLLDIHVWVSPSRHIRHSSELSTGENNPRNFHVGQRQKLAANITRK